MSNLDETMKRAAQLLETFVVTEATTRLQTLLDSYPWTLQTVLAPGGIDEHTPPASAVAADIAIVLAALAEAQRELSRLQAILDLEEASFRKSALNPNSEP